jgi:hypothetical protein
MPWLSNTLLHGACVVSSLDRMVMNFSSLLMPSIMIASHHLPRNSKSTRFLLIVYHFTPSYSQKVLNPPIINQRLFIHHWHSWSHTRSEVKKACPRDTKETWQFAIKEIGTRRLGMVAQTCRLKILRRQKVSKTPYQPVKSGHGGVHLSSQL